MKVINFGSINIDHVYSVEHFVQPGETLQSKNYQIFSGGKGANQSIALAYAGAKVLHAGKIGQDGIWLKKRLEKSGVDTDLIETVDIPTGHALIQVDNQGENAIIIHGGANQSFSDRDIDKVLAVCKAGDYLLLQNEINCVDKILKKLKGRGLITVFNPAPVTQEVKNYILDDVDTFIINKVEGEMLTGENNPQMIVESMQRLYPCSKILLTLGRDGLIYADGDVRIKKPALQVEAVDSTGAGDTFIGYFLAGVMLGDNIDKCLQRAIQASAICVSKPGAADSIPKKEELEKFSCS